jgi:hypothetical protein
MTVYPYRVQVTCLDGKQSTVTYYATSATTAHYIARELNPGCEVNVIGLEPEWEAGP